MEKEKNKVSESTHESEILDLNIFTSNTIEENAMKVNKFTERIPMFLKTILDYNQ